MSYAVQVNESNASRRVVYLWCVQSNGTTPAANEAGGQPNMSVGGLPMWASAATLSVISATAGHYGLVLGASDVSLLGQGTITYSSGTALPTSVNVEIVGYNPFTPYSLFTSGDSVGLKAQVHSGASVGVVDIAPAVGAISTLSFRPVPGNYGSTVTVGVNNITPGVGAISGLSFLPAPGAYSDVTVRISGGALTSAVSLAAGRYSNVSIGGVERLESAVTVDTGGIIAASFGVAAIDAAALATDAGQELADRLLARSIMGGSDSGRTVSEAFAVLRNRVQIDESTVTVYRTDDTTAYWVASITTVDPANGLINDLNPG